MISFKEYVTEMKLTTPGMAELLKLYGQGMDAIPGSRVFKDIQKKIAKQRKKMGLPVMNEEVDLQENLSEDVVQWLKSLLPKKLKHDINRMNHKEKYKKAIKVYHDFKREIEKEGKDSWLKKRGFSRSGGHIVGDIDKYLHDLAAEIAGVKPSEMRKVLNKKTRYS